MDDDTLSPEEQNAVMCLVEEFRNLCQQNQIPTIETFLNRASPSLRSALLYELVRIDREYRGDDVDADYYIQQLPRYKDQLRRLAKNWESERVSAEGASQDTVEYVVGSSEKIPQRMRYFGDYELLEEIARGGMGVVYKARQRSLRRNVAVKMILAGQFADDAQVKRFYAEAESAGRLHHKGIVPVFEVGEHKGQHFFSMEFVDGQSLQHKLFKEGTFTSRAAAKIVLQICEAIHFAHEHGIIHRDLKPANILLDQSGTPRISDFGLAKAVSDEQSLTVTGNILGTPSYMAPEQAEGKTDQIDKLADIYALGGILFALLTGNPPFKGKSHTETLVQVINELPASLRKTNPDTPIDLETITLKCLRKEKGKRYGDADELGQDLQRFLDGKPIHARRVGAIERTWKRAKRFPVVTGLLVMGVVLTTLAFASWRAKIITDQQDFETTKILVDELLSGSPQEFSTKLEGLTPKKKTVAQILSDQLAGLSGNRRVVGLLTLASFGESVVPQLIEAVQNADNEHYPLVHRYVARELEDKNAVVLILQEQFREHCAHRNRATTQSQRVAQLASSLMQFGAPATEILEAALEDQSDDSIEMELAVALHELETPEETLLEIGQAVESDESRRLIVLAIGLGNPSDDRSLERLSAWQHASRTAGLYTACEWAVGNQSDPPAMVLTDESTRTGRNVYMTDESHAMIVVRGPVEFLMGSPPSEPQRGSSETLHRRSIPRSFAMASKEVSVAQFKRFLKSAEPEVAKQFFDTIPDDLKTPEDLPQIGISWYRAAQYCNWLSDQEGIKEDEWAYRPNKYGDYFRRMGRGENHLEKLGYRLPSEAEWEYCCRAGSPAIRSFGPSPKLAQQQVWFAQNSGRKPHPIGTLMPNRYGFFDLLGNVSERCTDSAMPYAVVDGNPSIDGQVDNSPILDEDKLRTRGASYIDELSFARSAQRLESSASKRDRFVGFRVARTMPTDRVGTAR